MVLPAPLRGKALGNAYALHALRERRAELAGELVEVERRVAYIRDALFHLDGTLAQFDPNGDPKKIRPKKPYKRVKLFGHGRLNAMVYDALRNADRPLKTLEVVEAVNKALGFGPEAIAGLKQRVRSNLLYLHKVRGTIRKDGERETARWSIATAPPNST